jgi:hypothetical protein
MLAIVMSSETRPPSGIALRVGVLTRIPDVKFGDRPAGKTEAALLGLVDGYMIGLACMDAPCPISADDSCVRSAWYWPGVENDVASQKSHVVVSVTGGDDPRVRAQLLGQCVAATIGAYPGAFAVTWNTADALWPTQMVTRLVSPDDPSPPIMLCVSVKIFRERDGSRIGGITQGMAAFGHMEIEARDYSGEPGALAGELVDLASDVVMSGAAIEDGDTIGPDADTMFLVKHKASSLTKLPKVYRLYRDAA